MASVKFTIEGNFDEISEKAIRTLIEKGEMMPSNETPDDLKIPEEIIKNKDVALLSNFAAANYGKSIDKRSGWRKALQTAAQLRRNEVKRRKLTEKEEIMYRKDWPWKEGYRFFVGGPREDSHDCYVKDMKKGVEFFCLEEDLLKYLKEEFELPTAKDTPKDLTPKQEVKVEAAKKTAKARAVKAAKPKDGDNPSAAGVTKMVVGEAKEVHVNTSKGEEFSQFLKTTPKKED